ncbi:hypothetical protein LIER_06914 [Lithospermum erythrorhizon]|uniref:Uncharacterized protein n=1 Tax=Lithospermum erythrorhizon TaxID=34254 RepID=A0AAV3PAJ5_LITER
MNDKWKDMFPSASRKGEDSTLLLSSTFYEQERYRLYAPESANSAAALAYFFYQQVSLFALFYKTCTLPLQSVTWVPQI